MLSSKVTMTLMTEDFDGGEGAAPEAAMPQIEKEKGPRKKWPLGRLFSSIV